MSKDPIGYGIIGMGRQGEGYVRRVRNDANHADLIAATRSNARKGRAEANAMGVIWAESWQRRTQTPGVDAAVICIPYLLHRNIATTALEADNHVILEKPLAPTLPDGKAIAIATSKAACNGVKRVFAHTLLYSDVVKAAMKYQYRIGGIQGLNLTQRLEHKPLEWEHTKRGAWPRSLVSRGCQSRTTITVAGAIRSLHESEHDVHLFHTSPLRTVYGGCAPVRPIVGVDLGGVAGAAARRRSK